LFAKPGGGVRYEVRLAGEGGQGLILAGVILAEAAAATEGTYVAQTQSYGPEARGGASRSEVVISDHEIDYPRVVEADLLLAMSQEAYDRFGAELKQGLLTRFPLRVLRRRQREIALRRTWWRSV
jgi:2-oxoglutarate ferredoxin oxidoreductase subunit gamma